MAAVKSSNSHVLFLSVVVYLFSFVRRKCYQHMFYWIPRENVKFWGSLKKIFYRIWRLLKGSMFPPAKAHTVAHRFQSMAPQKYGTCSVHHFSVAGIMFSWLKEKNYIQCIFRFQKYYCKFAKFKIQCFFRSFSLLPFDDTQYVAKTFSRKFCLLVSGVDWLSPNTASNVKNRGVNFITNTFI